jgi:hypothetical protein
MHPEFLHFEESKMLRTTISGEFFLHKELWRVVCRQIEHAKANPQGAFYDDLVAMVFASHALEAYLNCAGEQLAPDFWKNERQHFRATGFAGKLQKILGLCGIAEPDKNSRPYKPVWDLKALRDRIAHAKPEKFSETFDHTEQAEPPLYRPPLGGLVTHENSLRAAEDIKTVVELIHSAAKARVQDDDSWFRVDALEGALSHSTDGTTVIS